MIGASINMTRKVPQIQKTSAAVELPGVVGWQTLVSAPLTMFRQTGYPSSAIATEAGKLRADTIKNFMYLISAPFLAIAVYYLLQLVAESVSTPVLVVMAFFTGLNSDRIVEVIAKTAVEHLPGNGDGDEENGDGEEKSIGNGSESKDDHPDTAADVDGSGEDGKDESG